MLIQVDLSLYPLQQTDLAPAIFSFIQSLEKSGLKVEIGLMSSVISGESELVFTALRQAYEAACSDGTRVLVAKFINPRLKGRE